MAHTLYSCIPIVFFKEMAIDRTMTLFDWLAMAEELPITGTEIHNQTLPGTDSASLRQVKAALERHRLSVSQLTIACDFTHPDPAYREGQLRRAMVDIDTAAALEATCVRLTAGQAHPGVSRRIGVQWVMENFRRLLEYAEAKGVFLAYENHYKDYFWAYPDFSQRAEVFLEIVGALRTSGLRVNFDTSNQVMIGEDPMTVLREVSDLVVHVHCSDRARPGEYRHAAAGEGVVDFPSLFRTLYASGYRGWLSVEYNGTEGMDGLRRALAYVRKTWEEVMRTAPSGS